MTQEQDAVGLLRGLHRAGVRHIVVGGLAVAAHGYIRATKDLDIVPAPDAENLDRLASWLREVQAEPVGLGDFNLLRLYT